MNLPISTHFPKEMPKHMAQKPTYFVEQINNALVAAGIATLKEIDVYETAFTSRFGHRLRSLPELKKHTIREDSKNRWQAGMKIHFFINNRKPDMFRFAPIVEVISTQRIEIVRCARVLPPYTYKTPSQRTYQIIVDGNCLAVPQMKQLAIWDGFNNLDDFFEWFKDDFTGKIIHWTNLKY